MDRNCKYHITSFTRTKVRVGRALSAPAEDLGSVPRAGSPVPEEPAPQGYLQASGAVRKLRQIDTQHPHFKPRGIQTVTNSHSGSICFQKLLIEKCSYHMKGGG